MTTIAPRLSRGTHIYFPLPLPLVEGCVLRIIERWRAEWWERHGPLGLPVGEPPGPTVADVADALYPLPHDNAISLVQLLVDRGVLHADANPQPAFADEFAYAWLSTERAVA